MTTRIEIRTRIDVPVEVAFGLATDIDIHVEGMADSDERAIGGVTSGRIGPGGEVIFQARYLGLRWRLTSRITTWDPPHAFADEQVAGPFARYRHEHRFSAIDERSTLMTDRWEHGLRWGPLGTLADRLVARRTVRELLETRASSFARIAEREHHGVSRRPDRLTVLYDQDCGFCTWSAETMMRIDRGHRVRFLPLAQAPALGIEVPDRDALEATIHAVDERGRWTVGGQTWITILDRVPVTRPFAWIARLPVVSRLVEPVYDRIAANRYRLSRMLRREACELPRRTS